MAGLTSKERLERCFRQEEIDRPGLFVWGVYDDRVLHKSYDKLKRLVIDKTDLKSIILIDYSDSWAVPAYKKESLNSNYGRFHHKFDTPKGELSKTYLYETSGKPGYIEEHFIKCLEDAEKYLSIPMTYPVLDCKRYNEEVAKMGDRGIVQFCLTMNPAGIVSELLGSQLFAIWSIDHRDLLHTLIEHERKRLEHTIKKVLETGLKPYIRFVGEEFIIPPLHGSKDFREFNVKYDKPLVNLVHEGGGYVEIHCHGPLKSVLDQFIEIGADVVHPIEGPPMGDITIKEAKEILKNKVCIEGNIQIGDMLNNDVEDIREQVLNIINDGFWDSKGLIICPTASPFEIVLSEKAFSNYEMMINTVLEYK